MLICIDGLDGAGKTTVAEALEQRFQSIVGDAVTSVTHRHLPAKTYEALSGATNNTMGLALQYLADMTDVATEDVAKIASATDWVIWDRGIFSTMVYQIPDIAGADHCAKLEAARKLYYQYLFSMRAVLDMADFKGCDLSTFVENNILIDTPVAVCMRRVASRGSVDPYESVPTDIWGRRSYDYYKYMSLFGQYIVKPTATTTVEAIVAEIWDNCIKQHLRGQNG